MQVKELIQSLEHSFPPYLQEKYDNSGNQVVFRDSPITGILCALDIDRNILQEAIEKNCNFILCHHPMIFRPLRNITTGDPKSEIIIDLVHKNISLYALHTNLDKMWHTMLGKALGLENTRLLIKTDTLPDQQEVGFGILANLPLQLDLEQFLVHVKKALKLDFVIYGGMLKQNIKRIAAINGSGGSSIEKIVYQNEVDCIVTGDVGYHHMKIALDHGVSVIDAGHFGTERILLDFLGKHIKESLTKIALTTDIPLYITEKEINPFRVF